MRFGRSILNDGKDWGYRISKQADTDLEALPDEISARVIEKLEKIINSEWREPPEWVEPLTGTEYQKVIVGDYRALVVTIRMDRIINPPGGTLT